MPHCRCTLTPCRVIVQSGESLCSFCAIFCVNELARRRRRRHVIRFVLAAGVVAILSYAAGLIIHHFAR